jgi:hypothetical protein
LNTTPPSGCYAARSFFCALAFVLEDRGNSQAANAPVIVFVTKAPEGELRFFIHPELRNIFKAKDLEYLDSLLWDFVERAKIHPEKLIAQISSLGGVGPLVVKAIGETISDFPALAELSKLFVEL